MNILRLIAVFPVLFSSYLFAQTCVDSIQASTPNTRFEINGNEIYDRDTDLVWQRCTLGLSGSGCDEGDFQALTWQAALQNAEDEQGGWRLPNIKELLSIVEDQCSSPSINLTVFPNTATNIYWSSTPVASDAARAWYVSQGHADKNPKNTEHYVRLVRDATADDNPTFDDALMVFTQSGAIKTNADLSHLESFDNDPTSSEEVDFTDFTKSVYGKYYMATTNGLSVSNNQGSTWSDFTAGDGLVSNNSSAIATHGYTSNPWLLVGSKESGISLSLDGGNTFSTYNVANDMLAGDSVNDVAIANDGTLYIATDTGLSIGWDVENGVFFENYTSEIGLPSDTINSIWVEDRSTINYVYLATDNGLAYSTDGGSDYSNSLSGHVLSAVVVKNDVWYVSTLSENGSTGGIYISTDLGQSYIYRDVNNGASVLNLSVTEHAIYANTEAGVSVSTDGGENFSLFTSSNSELPSNSVHAIVPFDETNIRLFASTEGLFISKDSGLSNVVYDVNTDGIEHSNVTSVSALGGRAIVITTESGASISYDLGDNWTSVLSGVHLSSSAYNSDTNTLVVGAIQVGIYLSTDGGETFSNKTTEDGLLSNVVTAVAINYEGIIYVGHSEKNDDADDLVDLDGVAGISGISVSEDGGNTFTAYQVASQEPRPFRPSIYNIHTSNEGDVFLSTDDGFKMSPSVEDGFSTFFDNQIDDAAIIDLDTWYIGSWDGLSITFDGGESFTTVTELADEFVDENEDYEENFIDGLKNGTEVSHVASDNNGLIYIYNEGELAQVVDEGRVVRYIETEYLNGLNSSELNDILMLAPVATDSDGDGFPDKIDSDNDNDGVADVNDAFPLDSSETLDTDGNGIGNNRDSDDDGDGMPDSYEQQYDFLNALDNSDAELDQDNDGFSNLAEFQAVTVPDEAVDTPNNSLVNKVVSVEGSYLDAFGADIALFDDTAVIMNTEYTADYDFVQYAFIYRKNDADLWEFQQKITASEVNDNNAFNGALAIYDDVLMLGGSNYQGGAVFVYYENDNNEWEIHETLTVSDGHETLGYSIALEGSRAVIGAYGKNDEGNNTGAAYIFERDDNNDWLEQQKLTADEIIDNDAFSASVALSGNTVLVGAWTDNTNGSVAGAAYIFEQDDDLQWQFNAKLIPADNNASDLFGYSVSLSDTTAIIGAFRTDDHGSSSGSAYIYGRNEQGSWEEMTKLTALDADTNAQFGYSVAIEGNMALVGAWSDHEEASYAGASYLFVKNTEGDWYQQQKIVAPDATADESFGASVILTPELMMIGTDLEDGNSFGSVYFIEIDTDLDGVPNSIDLDNDNDGYNNDIDDFPLDSSETTDTDLDGIGNNEDTDDDNDGVIDEFDIAPLDDDMMQLVILHNEMDNTPRGWKFGDELWESGIVWEFTADGMDKFLHLTGFDIDSDNELCVWFNDSKVGCLDKTENNAYGVSEKFFLAKGSQIEGVNQLELRQKFPGWKWGVTDVGLYSSDVLALNSIDFAKHGWNYDVMSDNIESYQASLPAHDVGYWLHIRGYDVDSVEELSLSLNGNTFAMMTPGKNKMETGDHLYWLPASLLTNAVNTFKVTPKYPGWRWGVTRVGIYESGVGLGNLLKGISGNAGDVAHQEGFTLHIPGGGSKLISLKGFDIDWETEVELTLNEEALGYMPKSPNNSFSQEQWLWLPESLLTEDDNRLKISHTGNPAFNWGVAPGVIIDGEIGLGRLPKEEVNEETVEQVKYLIPASLARIDYEIFDNDYDTEIEVYVEDELIGNVEELGNNVWSNRHSLDLLGDGLVGVLFNNTANPPNTYVWAVRMKETETE